MAWRRSYDKLLSEPMMIRLLTHICVTRPQWVNTSLVTNKIRKQPLAMQRGEKKICSLIVASNRKAGLSLFPINIWYVYNTQNCPSRTTEHGFFLAETIGNNGRAFITIFTLVIRERDIVSAFIFKSDFITNRPIVLRNIDENCVSNVRGVVPMISIVC